MLDYVCREYNSSYFMSHSNVNALINQSYLHIKKWFKNNKLALNIKKTAMIFKSQVDSKTLV